VTDLMTQHPEPWISATIFSLWYFRFSQ